MQLRASLASNTHMSFSVYVYLFQIIFFLLIQRIDRVRSRLRLNSGPVLLLNSSTNVLKSSLKVRKYKQEYFAILIQNGIVIQPLKLSILILKFQYSVLKFALCVASNYMVFVFIRPKSHIMLCLYRQSVSKFLSLLYMERLV